MATSQEEMDKYLRDLDESVTEETAPEYADKRADLESWYNQFLGRELTEQEWQTHWLPRANTADVGHWQEWVSGSKEARDYAARTAEEKVGTVEDVIEKIDIPYMGEVKPEGAIYEPEMTEQEQEIEKILFGEDGKGGLIRGEGIERVTPEKIASYKETVDTIMQPQYEQAMKDLSEEWGAMGRSFDTGKIKDVGRLTMEFGAKKTAMQLELAENDVDRINTQMGQALQRGMTFAQSEAAKEQLKADQQFQLDMYKRKVRDQAIDMINDVKLKDFYIRLQRAWDNADWEEYKALTKELAEAGKPELADQLWSFVEAVAPAVIAAVI